MVSPSSGKPREIKQKKVVKAVHVSADTGVQVYIQLPPQAKELQSHLKHTGHQRRSTNCINPCHRSRFYIIPPNQEAQLLVCHVGDPGPWSYWSYQSYCTLSPSLWVFLPHGSAGFSWAAAQCCKASGDVSSLKIWSDSCTKVFRSFSTKGRMLCSSKYDRACQRHRSTSENVCDKS